MTLWTALHARWRLWRVRVNVDRAKAADAYYMAHANRHLEAAAKLMGQKLA